MKEEREEGRAEKKEKKGQQAGFWEKNSGEDFFQKKYRK